MLIRIAKQPDMQQAFQVLQICFQRPSVSLEDLHNTQSVIFVAEEDSKIVGTLSLTVTATFSYIDDLAVLPTYQHRGIATQLVQAALNISEQNTPETYAVCVSQWSARICKHLGFKHETYGRYTKYHKPLAK